MKTHDIEQGTLEWLRLRIGKVTASEMSNLLTPDFEPRKGEMPYTYLCEKLAEVWRKQPLPAFGAWATEQGLILQDEAIPWYELEFDCRVHQVGFIDSDDGLTGCSPDGLLPYQPGEILPHGIIPPDVPNKLVRGIEIKCPSPQVHVKYLLNGVVPKEYVTQIHGSMFVTGFKSWKFLSYRRGFPPLILTVQRDEEIIQKIGAAIEEFHSRLSEAKERLTAQLP